MSLEFDDKDENPANCPNDLHPFAFYLQGNAETICDVILNHPDVICFVYVNKNIVTKALPTPKSDKLQYYGSSQEENYCCCQW